MSALLADLGTGHNIAATVHIESRTEDYRQDGPAHLRALGETEAVASLPRPVPGICTAIIAHADLSLGPNLLSETLFAHELAGDGRFRGVRTSAFVEFSPDHQFQLTPRPGWERSVRAKPFLDCVCLIGEAGYTLDLVCTQDQLECVTWIAERCPQTTVIVDHLAPPAESHSSSRGGVANWQKAIARAAKCNNVVVKIGGCLNPLLRMNMPAMRQLISRPIAPSSSEVAAAYRPFASAVIGALGADRCMFESNFPIEKTAVDYRTLWNAFKRIAEPWSKAERDAVFCRTAARTYRLDLPPGDL